MRAIISWGKFYCGGGGGQFLGGGNYPVSFLGAIVRGTYFGAELITYFCKPSRKGFFKTGLSSLSDSLANYKEKVPDVRDCNQKVETTCNSKLKFTERKDLFIKKVQKS